MERLSIAALENCYVTVVDSFVESGDLKLPTDRVTLTKGVRRQAPGKRSEVFQTGLHLLSPRDIIVAKPLAAQVTFHVKITPTCG